MKRKTKYNYKLTALIIMLFLSCAFFNAQVLLPYSQNNICLDQLMNVNPNTLSNTKNLVVEDLDNDGLKEVIVTDVLNDNIQIYQFNPGSGTFTVGNSFLVPGGFGTGKHQAIATGEFTGDLLQDLVFTTDSFIYVFKNNNSFLFTPLYQLPIPANFCGQEHYLKTDNINNSGFDEFYLISSNTSVGPGITVIPYLSSSTNIFPQSTYTIFKSSGNLLGASLDISLGNIQNDPDGLKDVMITYSNVPDSVVFLNNNSTSTSLQFTQQAVYLPPGFPFTSPDFTILSSELADLNNDSKLDFIFYGNTTAGAKIKVYAGTNSFSLVFHVDIPVSGVIVNDFKIADINKDGISDVIGVGSYQTSTFSGLVIYPGNGNTTTFFGTPVTVTFTNNAMRPDEIQVTDVDKNGLNDIVIKPWKVNVDRTYMIPNFSFPVNASPGTAMACSSMTAMITASCQSTSGNYNWIDASSNAVVISNSVLTTTVGGNYFATLDILMYSGSNCKLASDTVHVIDGTPVLNLSTGNTVNACYGNTVSTTVSGAATYSWSAASTAATTNNPTFTIQALSNAVYTITGILTNGCVGKTLLNVNLFPLNTNNIFASKNPACAGDQVTLSMPSVASYTWSNASFNPSISVMPNTTTTYYLAFTDLNGCVSARSITLDIDPNCASVIYTGVTLNGNNQNSFFRIDNIEKFTNNHVSIFNRWGQEIFSTNKYDNINNYWPPKNGENLPPSTYFYVVDFGDGSQIKKGWVELTTN